MFIKMTRHIPMQGVDKEKVIKHTPGYVAADFKALITEAAVSSV